MYYRYRSKQKGGKLIKFIIIMAVISAVFFIIFKYQNQFKFWKYTFSKIEREYNKVESCTDCNKLSGYQDLMIKLQKSYDDDVSNERTILLLAKTNFKIAELYFKDNFTSIIIKDKKHSLPKNSAEYYRNSLIFTNKFIAFNEGEIPEDEILIILSKLYFYLDFNNRNIIYENLKKIRKPEEIKSNDDKRFFGYMCFMETEDEQYIEFLKDIEQKNMDDQLFLAGVYLQAKQYTNAIVKYKDILRSKVDGNIKIIIFKNLGKIYYNQSLLDESLKYLLDVYRVKPNDQEVRQLIYEIYMSKKDKKQAELYKSV